MNHLKTSEERRERWHSKQSPRYVPVKTPNSRHDILSLAKHHDNHYSDHVYGIPFLWLREDNDDLLSKVLETHGFAVVTGVLSLSDCEHSLEKAWDYIEAASCAEQQQQQQQHQQQQQIQQQQQQQQQQQRKDTTLTHSVPPIARHNPSSHSSKYFPHSLEGGFLPFYGSGHSTFAWSIRSHPNVRRVFECIHNTSDLISSLDGIVLWHKSQPQTDAGWFHLDQNPIAKPGKACIQALVNLLPVTENTGGNVVVPKSHNFFPHHYHNDNVRPYHDCSDFYKARLEELGEEDWMEIDPNDSLLLQPQSNVTCLLGPGDMILWDSRTIHCSNPKENTISSSTDREGGVKIPAIEKSAHGLIRAAAAVSMMPTNRATSSVLEQRRLAVNQKRTLTHWVNKVAPLGQENTEQIAMEASRVKFLLDYQRATNAKVLLEYYEDLTVEQQALVVGEADAHGAITV
jgi:hypothetical protein